MFTAYLLDPEDGWAAVHRLPLDSAVITCRDFRRRTAGSVVAIVPDGANPNRYLELVGAKGFA